MGLGNLLLLSQVTLYVLSFIISFFIFVPLTVNHNEFQGHCLLHARGTWEAQKFQVTSWGNQGDCSFGIFVGVVLFPISLFYILWMSVYLFKGTEPSWASAFVALLVSIVTCLMIFVSGIVLTSGFNAWCAALEPEVPCGTADYAPFLKDLDNINTRHFNVELGMAQFGLWTTWVIWLLLVVLASIQIYQYHNQEDFFTSLHRERERLIQRINPNAQASYSV